MKPNNILDFILMEECSSINCNIFLTRFCYSKFAKVIR